LIHIVVNCLLKRHLNLYMTKSKWSHKNMIWSLTIHPLYQKMDFLLIQNNHIIIFKCTENMSKCVRQEKSMKDDLYQYLFLRERSLNSLGVLIFFYNMLLNISRPKIHKIQKQCINILILQFSTNFSKI
jgi:hypothetical protein